VGGPRGLGGDTGRAPPDSRARKEEKVERVVEWGFFEKKSKVEGGGGGFLGKKGKGTEKPRFQGEGGRTRIYQRIGFTREETVPPSAGKKGEKKKKKLTGKWRGGKGTLIGKGNGK